MHGEEDSEVHGQAAPDEEVVDGRPVARVQPDLHRAAAVTAGGAVTPKPRLLPRNSAATPRAARGTGGSLLAEGTAVPGLLHTCTLTTMTNDVATVTAKDW